MADKLRAGIIGCGFTRNHVYGFLLSGRYEVTAVCDLYPEVMQTWDHEFKEMGFAPHHYTDAREMLSKEQLDVISIGTWQAGHARWTVAAAAARPKAIIIEKPIASTLQDAEQQIVACRRNKVKCIVGHQRRFLPSYTMARSLVAQGAIGQVQIVECLGADGLPNQFTHQTDMLRYVLGDDDCEWVMGNVERKTDRWERGTRIEDCATGVLQFRGGARAVLLSDMLPALGGVEVQGGRFYGSEGMMFLSTEEVHLSSKETGGEWRVFCPDGQFFTVAKEHHRFEWLEGAVGQATELADWIEGKVDTHRNEATNGYKALEIVLAVYESARCHEKVTLPLQTRLSPLELMIDSGHLAPTRPGRYDVRLGMLHGERLYTDGSTGEPL